MQRYDLLQQLVAQLPWGHNILLIRIIFHWRTLIGSGNTDVRGRAQIFFIILIDYKQAVAPFAGAWIQTLRSLWRCVRPFVASFAGAWKVNQPLRH